MKTLFHRLALATLALLPAAAALAQTGEAPIGILVAAGDISTCGNNEKWLKYSDRTADLAKAIIAGANGVPVTVLALGDLAYGSGTADDFTCFAQHWSGLDAYILPVPGNHEYLTARAKPFYDFFKDNVAIKQNGTGKGYFSLPFPNQGVHWTLIGLNSNLTNAARKLQSEWLKTALGSATQSGQSPCILTFWHAPIFSSGRHGHNYSTKKAEPVARRSR